MTRRFHSEEYLIDYRDHGRFPSIHDAIFFAANGYCQGVVGDLCSCTGLLGQRFNRLAGVTTRCLEGNPAFIKLGLTYGVYGGHNPVSEIAISPTTMPLVREWLSGVDMLVARRCFPEISNKISLDDFAEAVDLSGVRIIALEGQLQSTTATHPYGGADQQAAPFMKSYSTLRSTGNVRILQRKQRSH